MQYRINGCDGLLLPMQIHPDKSSCFGAEAAFQLLGQALSSFKPQAKRHRSTSPDHDSDDHLGSDWEDAFFGDLHAPHKRPREDQAPEDSEQQVSALHLLDRTAKRWCGLNWQVLAADQQGTLLRD